MTTVVVGMVVVVGVLVDHQMKWALRLAILERYSHHRVIVDGDGRREEELAHDGVWVKAAEVDLRRLGLGWSDSSSCLSRDPKD